MLHENKLASGLLNCRAHFLRNIGGIPSGPPLVFIFRRLMTRCTNSGLNTMLLNLLSLVGAAVGGMVPLSCVNLFEKNVME